MRWMALFDFCQMEWRSVLATSCRNCFQLKRIWWWGRDDDDDDGGDDNDDDDGGGDDDEGCDHDDGDFQKVPKDTNKVKKSTKHYQNAFDDGVVTMMMVIWINIEKFKSTSRF